MTGTNGSGVEIKNANPNCLIVANADQLSNTSNVIVSGTCANLELVDGKPFKAPAAFTATAAKFTKTVSDAGYATMVIPFAAALPAGVTAKNLTGVDVDGETITTTEATSIAADQPVLIKATATDYEFTATGAAVAATAEGVVSNGLLRGTYANTTAAADTNNYVLQNSDTYGVNFYLVTGTAATMKPFRAYLTTDGSTARLFLNLDEATDINTVNGEEVMGNDCFDLQGRRVSQPTRGLYIMNGRKVLVK